MTNKEYLARISDKECSDLIIWLVYSYSFGFTDSSKAIEEWLGKTRCSINNCPFLKDYPNCDNCPRYNHCW